MKNIFTLSILFSCCIMISSCGDEFLNPIPTTSVVANDFFSTDAELLTGIYSIYDALQGVNENTQSNWNNFNRGVQFEYLLTDMRSDNTRSETFEGSKADFHRYLLNANNVEVEDYYASMYQIIFRANTVLSFIDVADPANVSAYTAEAKFLRGLAYLNLVRLFGEVPIVITTVGPADESVFQRQPISAVYTQIIADLTDAENNLASVQSKGRASKEAAQGLLAKAHLSQPAPDYLEAQRLCEAVMNSGSFSLMDDYGDVFYNELNDELIFVVEYIAANADESQSFSSEFNFDTGRQDGLNIPEPNLISAFAINGGNRTEYSLAEGSGGRTECAKYYPDGFGFDDGYGDNSRNAGNDFIVLRYADILLLHAEAILAGGQSSANAAALASVNQVRTRAGLEDLTGELSAPELLLERRVELAFESQRLFDLQRFGVATTVLTAYAADENLDFSVNQLLLPIPAREINLSRGVMSQNPGY